MVIDEPNVNVAMLVDHAVIQESGDGREWMQGRRSESGINTQAESAEIMGAFAAPPIQGDPPSETPQRPGKTAHAQCLSKGTDILEIAFLEAPQGAVQIREAALFRFAHVTEENGFLIAKMAFDGDGRD